MKHLLVFLFLISSVSVFAQSAGIYCSRAHGAPLFRGSQPDDLRSDTFDILNTSIHLDFTNASNQQIGGYSRLSIEALQNGVSSIRMDLEGLAVDSVLVNNSQASYAHSGAKLSVDLGMSLSVADTFSLKVYYGGTPLQDASGWGGFYFQGDFAWNLGVGFAADPHSYGRVWFPCFDNFIERSTYDFHITVNEGFRAACNGELTGVDAAGGTSTFHWRLDQPASSYLACVAVAKYEVLEWTHSGNSSNFPVMLHARAQDTANLRASFQNLDDAITTFEDSYGDYSWNKVGYSLVPFGSGAMEHVTNITYPIYAANGQLSQESLMAHELAHMWWGDLVTCETDEDMWINEGWASFSEFLVEEQLYGRDAYERAMLEDLRYMLQFGHHLEEQYRPVSGQPHEYVYGDHVYKKGALVAHNLRGYLGDEVFFDAVTTFLNEYAFSAVSSEDFRDYLTQYTGTNMTDFFDDWIFNPGYSVVVLNRFESESIDAGYEVSMFVQQKTKGTNSLHSNIPVYYTIYGAGFERQKGQASLAGEYAVLMDTVPFEPALVVLYEQNELAMAQTSEQVMLTGPQNAQNLTNAFLTQFEVTSVETDSALLRIDHVWSYPPSLLALDQPYQLSDYRYWNVTGINLEDVTMKTTLVYDGRVAGGTTGYLDIGIASGTEDSLILLYRQGDGDDWDEYPDYEKNVMGSSSDGFGRMEISDFKPGQYVLGRINNDVLGLTSKQKDDLIKIYPNPAHDRVTVAWGQNQAAEVVILDSAGRSMFKGSLSQSRLEVSTLGWKSGSYVVQILAKDGTRLQESLVITH